MFGPEYYTIAAYLGDGEIYCPDCWKSDSIEEDNNASLTQATVDNEFPEGLYCGACMKEIAPPREC